jgi:hypothetical protein
MSKIIGNTTTTPVPRSDWAQTNPEKVDFIKNKPDILTEEDVVQIVKDNGVQSESLAPVATSGSFNDLKHKPSIVLSLNDEGVLCLNVIYSYGEEDEEQAVIYEESGDRAGVTIVKAYNATVTNNELEVF